MRHIEAAKPLFGYGAGVGVGLARGQTRLFKISGGSGGCVKSKLSSISLASASRSVSGGSWYRLSTKLRNEENSYTVCEISPARAYGDMINSGTRGPKPKRSRAGG